MKKVVLSLVVVACAAAAAHAHHNMSAMFDFSQRPATSLEPSS